MLVLTEMVTKFAYLLKYLWIYGDSHFSTEAAKNCTSLKIGLRRQREIARLSKYIL